MANTTIKIPRAHLIMALCLPLAVLLGYFLAEPMESGSTAVIVLVMFVLAVPLMMKWHHPILVLGWNACITPVFLPGLTQIWVPLAAGSLVFALLNRSVSPEARFIYVPSLANSLLFLTAIVLMTAWATGGIGLRSMGSAKYGGRNYVLVLMAVAGFFAFSSVRIPTEKAGAYVAMYFLAGVTGIIPNIIYLLGPAFYPLYAIFPAGVAFDQARADFALEPGIFRLYGLPFLGAALYCSILALYGVKGTLDFSRPWRFLCLMIGLICYVASGFRGSTVGFAVTFCLLFCFEGLHRTRMLPLLLGMALAGAAALLPITDKLPLVVQRTISFLPVKIDPIARETAEYSTKWRLEIWKQAIPEIPKYLLIGKGYSMDPNALYMSTQSAQQMNNAFDSISINSEYHNGPLSVLIPFGIFGAIGFIWFLVAAGRFLYHNYRFGDPRLLRINAFFVAFFITKVLFFFLVFGSFYSDLYAYTGLIGLSVSLNGQPEPATEPELTETEQSTLEAFS